MVGSFFKPMSGFVQTSFSNWQVRFDRPTPVPDPIGGAAQACLCPWLPLQLPKHLASESASKQTELCVGEGHKKEGKPICCQALNTWQAGNTEHLAAGSIAQHHAVT